MSATGGGGVQDRDGCLACRGTGAVVSNLGGSPHRVRCPWCSGTGRRQPGRDAQEDPPAPPAA